MCKKPLLLLVLALLSSFYLSAQGISQEKSEAITSQVDLAQTIVNRLIASLDSQKASILQEQQNLTDEKTAFDLEKSHWLDEQQKEKQDLEQEKKALQEEKDTFKKQQELTPQIEKTLKDLQKSYQTSEFWHKIKNYTIIALVGTCIVEGIIIATK